MALLRAEKKVSMLVATSVAAKVGMRVEQRAVLLAGMMDEKMDAIRVEY